MSKPRTYTLDNLRTYLTILVILHHAVVPYGGAGSWLYASLHHAPGSSYLLLAFNVINQSFFMATFFLISAYFSSIAARKRTRKTFLIEKWKRLGVPTLVYSLVAPGLLRGIIARRSGGESWASVWEEVMAELKSVRGAKGPMWYCALLLVFDALYAMALPSHFAGSSTSLSESSSPSTFSDKSTIPESKDPGPSLQTQLNSNVSSNAKPFQTILILTLLCVTATSSFIIRLAYPIGVSFQPLNLQLGFASQYVLYYITGISIHRSSQPLPRAASNNTIYLVRTITVGIVFIAFGITYIAHVITTQSFNTDLRLPLIANLVRGGPNRFALVYAFWNEFAGFFLTTTLIRIFHNLQLVFLSRRWTIAGADVAKYSYAAFLVHTPVLVDLQYRFSGGYLEQKSAMGVAVVVGMLGVVLSWVFGWCVKEGVERMGWRGYI